MGANNRIHYAPQQLPMVRATTKADQGTLLHYFVLPLLYGFSMSLLAIITTVQDAVWREGERGKENLWEARDSHCGFAGQKLLYL